jgi:hypothetical protein
LQELAEVAPINNDGVEEPEKDLAPDTQKSTEVEQSELPKGDHLIPLSRHYDSDSDLDIEIVNKKPKMVVVENQIANSILDSRKRMLQLAAEQKEKRRVEELEERRKEIEDLKRRRKERREARKLEEQQRKALELENKNLQETNQIEGENDVEHTENPSQLVQTQSVVEDSEKTADVESHIHLEYKTDSEISLELDSGSDLESSIVKTNQPHVEVESRKDEVNTMSTLAPIHTDKVEPIMPMQIDEQEDLMDLLSGTFAETQRSQLEESNGLQQPISTLSLDYQSGNFKFGSKLEKSQQSESGMMDLLSGSFPPTQPLDVDMGITSETHFSVPKQMDEKEEIGCYKSDAEGTEIDPADVDEPSSEDRPDCSQEGPSNVSSQQELSIQDILDMDNDSESDPAIAEEEEEAVPPASEEQSKLVVKWSVVENVNAKIQKSGPRFVETEAEVEEDEFMNFGGADGEELHGKDEYDKSLLADSDEDVGDMKAVMELHHQKLAAEDQNMVNTIINDVTSGAYRKRKSLREGGMGLDLYDSDEETEAILKKIRQKMGLNYNSKTGEAVFDPNSLEILASNPKTKAFAEVFQVKEEESRGFLSSSDEESKIETFKTRVRTTLSKRKLYRSTSQSDQSQTVCCVYYSRPKKRASNLSPQFQFRRI